MDDSLVIKRNELLMQTWMILNITVPNGRREARKHTAGTFRVVRRLKPQAPNAGSTSLISGWGTKIPHAARYSPQKIKNKNGEGDNTVQWKSVFRSHFQLCRVIATSSRPGLDALIWKALSSSKAWVQWQNWHLGPTKVYLLLLPASLCSKKLIPGLPWQSSV